MVQKRFMEETNTETNNKPSNRGNEPQVRVYFNSVSK